MDDVTACGNRKSLELFYTQLATASEDAGLHINESKCELWDETLLTPDGSSLEKIPLAEWIDGIVLLGLTDRIGRICFSICGQSIVLAI